MAKKLKPQALVSRLKERYTYAEIAEATGYSERQLQRIKSKGGGARAEAAIREFYDLGKRAQAKAVKGETKIEKRRERPVKNRPADSESPPQEASPPSPPPPPSEVSVSIRGNIGPSRDPEYIRRRTISTTMKGEHAAEFAKLWFGEDGESRAAALEYAVSHYFGSAGEGHLESVIGRPSVSIVGGE